MNRRNFFGNCVKAGAGAIASVCALKWKFWKRRPTDSELYASIDWSKMDRSLAVFAFKGNLYTYDYQGIPFGVPVPMKDIVAGKYGKCERYVVE